MTTNLFVENIIYKVLPVSLTFVIAGTRVQSVYAATVLACISVVSYKVSINLFNAFKNAKSENKSSAKTLLISIGSILKPNLISSDDKNNTFLTRVLKKFSRTQEITIFSLGISGIFLHKKLKDSIDFWFYSVPSQAQTSHIELNFLKEIDNNNLFEHSLLGLFSASVCYLARDYKELKEIKGNKNFNIFSICSSRRRAPNQH